MSENLPLIRMTLYGDPRTKKNSQQPVTVKTKDGKEFTRVLPSKQFMRYQKDCLRQITGKYRVAICERVNCKYLFFMKTHRVVDALNLQEGMDDILVEADVLLDDNVRIAAAHDGSRVYYDNNNPRVEITITRLEDEDNGYQLV